MAGTTVGAVHASCGILSHRRPLASARVTGISVCRMLPTIFAMAQDQFFRDRFVQVYTKIICHIIIRFWFIIYLITEKINGISAMII